MDYVPLVGGVILLGLAIRRDSSYIKLTWCDTKHEDVSQLSACEKYQNSFLDRAEAFSVRESEKLSQSDLRLSSLIIAA